MYINSFHVLFLEVLKKDCMDPVRLRSEDLLYYPPPSQGEQFQFKEMYPPFNPDGSEDWKSEIDGLKAEFQQLRSTLDPKVN